MSSAPKRLNSFNSPCESLELDEQFEYIHSYFVWEWRRKHGTKKLFGLIASAKPNLKILDEIILLRLIERERLDISISLINSHQPTMEWILTNSHRLKNDELAWELFISKFRKNNKTQDLELEKRILLFGGINFPVKLEFSESETILFANAFKDEFSKSESKLIGPRLMKKIFDKFRMFVHLLSGEQWLKIFTIDERRISNLIDIHSSAWRPLHFENDSLAAHLYISGKGVEYTKEVIKNCNLAPDAIIKILRSLVSKEINSHKCQDFICNFLEKNDIKIYASVAAKMSSKLIDSPNKLLDNILQNYLDTNDIDTLGDRIMSLVECHESLPIFNSKVELFFSSSNNLEQQSRVLSRLIDVEFKGINDMDLSPEQTSTFDGYTYCLLYEQYEKQKHVCIEAITSSFLNGRSDFNDPREIHYFRLIADVLENLEQQDANFQISNVEKYLNWLKYLTKEIRFRSSLNLFSFLRSQRRSRFAKLFRDFYDKLDKQIKY